MHFSVKYRSFIFFWSLIKTVIRVFEHRKYSDVGNCGRQSPPIFFLQIFHLTVTGAKLLVSPPILRLTILVTVVDALASLAQNTGPFLLAVFTVPNVAPLDFFSYRVVHFSFILRRTDAKVVLVGNVCRNTIGEHIP